MATGWLATLETAWPYVLAIGAATWAVIRFGAEQRRQSVKDAAEATLRAETAAEKASAARLELENQAAKLAAERTDTAMKSLERALERANAEIAQNRQDRAHWADVERQLRDELAAEREARRKLSAKVDELSAQIEADRERFRQKEEHLAGEVRQRDQIIASLQRQKKGDAA